MKVTHTLAALFLTLSAATPVAAGPLEDAVVARDSGDYATAFSVFQTLANQGVTRAQFYLAKMYIESQGLQQDLAEPLQWGRKAAEQGYAAAQSNIGSKYADGEDVPRDDVRAYMWLSLAAAQGNQLSSDFLGD